MHTFVTVVIVAVAATFCVCLVVLFWVRLCRSRGKAKAQEQARVVSEPIAPPPATKVLPHQPASTVTTSTSEIQRQSLDMPKHVVSLPATKKPPHEPASTVATSAKIGKCKHGVPLNEYCINCKLEKPLWDEEHVRKHGDYRSD